MRNPFRVFGFRATMAHTVIVAAVTPAVLVMYWNTQYRWWCVAGVAVVALLAVVTFRGRRLLGWIGAMCAWLMRHRTAPSAPSQPAVGATVMPADHVAVRWEGRFLVALIELVPRPFTPTVIVDGRVHTDDVVDTALVEQLLSIHCPDMSADVVSAGRRVGDTAPSDLVDLYTTIVGTDPAPAHRRTWVVVRADPSLTERSARRRDSGVAGLARYLVASTTRLADQLAGHGVDARCARSFDDYDHATEISFVREKWSRIRGESTFTAAYTAAGGPDVWWAAQADHTITRVRVTPGRAPSSTVVLTTATKVKSPKGFSRISGGQRAAVRGDVRSADRHCHVPIGSAGVLVGQTTGKCPVYMSFDDVDTSITLGDALSFMQFASRAAAAGGVVTLEPQFRDFADMIGARTGVESKVIWPQATTYLGPHPGLDRVMLRSNVIGTPRHRKLPIQPVTAPDERPYQMALPR